jgi:hypothetical protein
VIAFKLQVIVLCSGDHSLWRYTFLTGLLAGGLALQVWQPTAFDPATTLGALSLPRIAAAGNSAARNRNCMCSVYVNTLHLCLLAEKVCVTLWWP